MKSVQCEFSSHSRAGRSKARDFLPSLLPSKAHDLPGIEATWELLPGALRATITPRTTGLQIDI